MPATIVAERPNPSHKLPRNACLRVQHSPCVGPHGGLNLEVQRLFVCGVALCVVTVGN